MKPIDLLDAPFFEGTTSITSDVPAWQPIAINGHPFVIDPGLYQRITIERFRNPYDQSQEPGEHSLNTRGPWLRSSARWNHGAGQDFWDQSDSDRAQFYTSKGIDVWSSAVAQTSQNRIQLLHDTRNIYSSVASNLRVWSVNGYVYVADGVEVHIASDPDEASPTWQAIGIQDSEPDVTVEWLTTDGTTVWAALGSNGIHTSTVGATSSTHFSDYEATLVEYANGRLIAANGNELVEIAADGSDIVLKQHDNTSFAWVTICGAPNGIYVSGVSGDRSEIYFVGLKADGSLDVPRYAGTLPDGEYLNAMTFYNGVVVLGTSLGMRLAQITNADGISYASAIKIAGGVSCLEPQAEFVWFGWTNFDGSSSGLGRASLGANSFTSDFVPAYASDLMADEGDFVSSVCTSGNLRYFAIHGAGVFAEFDELVESGTLNTGWINYSTAERKTAISVDIRHEPLAGSIDVTLTEENGTTLTVGSTSSPGSLGPDTPMGVNPISSESFQLTFTLTRSADPTLGPVLRRWTFRSLITPWRADEIHIPIILKERVLAVDTGDGHEVDFEPLEEWLFLKSLEATGTPVSYQEGTQSYVGYIEQVELPADKTRKWTGDRDFMQGLVMVRFITLSPAA